MLVSKGGVVVIKIVKTWCENTQEGENYLKYNKYGIVKRILDTDYYLCIGARNAVSLTDVKVIIG
jgi:hypothetical protein